MFKAMKMSKYNLTVYDHEGNLIIYNFMTGIPSLTKIMKNDVDKFAQLFLIDSEIHSKSLEEHAEVVDGLLKSGILVAGDTDESVLHDSKHYEEVYDNKLNLFILPTGECNFSCTYCFETTKPFSRDAMTLEAQNNLIKFVQRHIHNHKELHVTWFGGEPLMELEIIKRLSEKFIKICNARFLSYSAEMITNGFLLNADIFDMLYKLKIYYYMVTIDGFKEQHDKLRFTRNGMGSYDAIMDNLLRIRNNKQYRFVHVKIRVNMTSGFSNILDDFVCFLASSFSDDPRFSFAFMAAADFSDSEYSDNDLFLNDDEVFSHLRNNEVYMSKLCPEEFKIDPIIRGKKCIASLKNSYVITPDLNVHKCYVHYEMDFNKIGCISLKGDLLLDETLHRRWYLQNKFIQKIPETCSDCFYLPCCHIGGKVCSVRYLMPKSDAIPCQLKNEKYIKLLTETVLYAAHKYSCTVITV